MKNVDAGISLLMKRDLTTAEVARVLNVSTGTVQHLADENILLSWRTSGGHRRIRSTSLYDYIKRNNIIDVVKASVGPNLIVGSYDANFINNLKVMMAFYECKVNLHVCDSLQNAISSIYRVKSSVIVLDINLFAEQDVVEWLRSLRESKGSARSCPIILVRDKNDVLSDSLKAVCLTHLIKVVVKNCDWLTGYVTSLFDQSVVPDALHALSA